MTQTWLSSVLGQEIIELAGTFPDALTGVTKLRAKFPEVSPELITAAMTQARLREKLFNRWAIDAQSFLLTQEGLEQASRPLVSKFRSEWVSEKFGKDLHILDLTCGLGFDALAFARAVHQVTCYEIDDEIAEMARHNLAGLPVTVITADVTKVKLPADYDLIFIDPARRDPQAARKSDGSAIRIFDPARWSPSWDFIASLTNQKPVLVKVAPGIDDESIKDWDVQWISADGDLVEAMLSWPGSGKRLATILNSQMSTPIQVEGGSKTSAQQLGRWLVVPDAALIRAGALTPIAQRINGGLVNEHIAWLTSDDAEAVESLVRENLEHSMVFEIVKITTLNEKVLTKALAEFPASALTIMTRGVTINVEALRRKVFKNKERTSPELILAVYREDSGPVALICRRIA